MSEMTLEESKIAYRERFERVVDALIAETFEVMRERTPVEHQTARDAWTLDVEGRKITNNAPHILRLEWGWSNQAPIGMARLTVAETDERVQRIARDLP